MTEVLERLRRRVLLGDEAAIELLDRERRRRGLGAEPLMWAKRFEEKVAKAPRFIDLEQLPTVRFAGLGEPIPEVFLSFVRIDLDKTNTRVPLSKPFFSEVIRVIEMLVATRVDG